MAKAMSSNGLITIDGAGIPLVSIPNIATAVNNNSYVFNSVNSTVSYSYQFDWLVSKIARDIKTANDEDFNKLVAIVKKELALRNLKKIDE
jgi:hypothetical protein